MQSVLFDSSLADSLRSKGEQRLKLFSWHNCGQGTLNVLIK
jgi:hypothetical protein